MARKHVINAKFSENCILTFPENYVVASFLFGILLFLCKIFFSHNQAPVVQKVDNTIQWINLDSVDNAIGFPNTYSLDCVLSNG